MSNLVVFYVFLTAILIVREFLEMPYNKDIEAGLNEDKLYRYKRTRRRSG